MRQVTIFINDYTVNRRSAVAFSSHDYDEVESLWDQEDDRLLRLQTLPFFQGLTKWSQLRTEHFRLLIMQTMTLSGDLTDADRVDPDHPVNRALHFLLLAMVRCIERSTTSIVELLHLHRVSNREISFDYTAIMEARFPKPPKKPETGDFTIISLADD